MKIIKKILFSIGVQTLLEAKRQIEKALEEQLKEFEPVEENQILRLISEIKKPGYHRSKDCAVNYIQENYELCIQVAKFLVVIYTYMGELPVAELQYSLTKRFLLNLNFSNVKTIDYIHKNENTKEKFYNQSIENIQLFQDNYIKDMLK